VHVSAPLCEDRTPCTTAVPTPTASLPGVRDADAAERFERLLVAVDTDSAAVAVDDVDATEQVRDPTHAPSAVSDAVQSRDQLPVTPVRLAAVCRPHTACSNSQPHSVSSVDHRLSERQTLAAAALWRVALSTTRATVEMLYKKTIGWRDGRTPARRIDAFSQTRLARAGLRPILA